MQMTEVDTVSALLVTMPFSDCPGVRTRAAMEHQGPLALGWQLEEEQAVAAAWAEDGVSAAEDGAAAA